MNDIHDDRYQDACPVVARSARHEEEKLKQMNVLAIAFSDI